MKSLLSFRHPHVVPNLYTFLCSAEHKGRYFEEHILTTQAHAQPKHKAMCLHTKHGSVMILPQD